MSPTGDDAGAAGGWCNFNEDTVANNGAGDV
jgi:hypothetical protein